MAELGNESCAGGSQEGGESKPDSEILEQIFEEKVQISLNSPTTGSCPEKIWIEKIDAQLMKLYHIPIPIVDLRWISYGHTRQIIRHRLEERKRNFQAVLDYECNPSGNLKELGRLMDITDEDEEKVGMDWLLKDVDRFRGEVYSQRKRLSMPLSDIVQHPPM